MKNPLTAVRDFVIDHPSVVGTPLCFVLLIVGVMIGFAFAPFVLSHFDRGTAARAFQRGHDAGFAAGIAVVEGQSAAAPRPVVVHTPPLPAWHADWASIGRYTLRRVYPSDGRLPAGATRLAFAVVDDTTGAVQVLTGGLVADDRPAVSP